MKILIILPFLLISNNAFACDSDGFAGVKFGQHLSDFEPGIEPQELNRSGVNYYYLSSHQDISPFERIVIGITPDSKNVYSIELRAFKPIEKYQPIVDKVKNELNKKHKTIEWEKIDYYYYGNTDKIEVVLSPFWEMKKGKRYQVLSYSCDNKKWRSKMFKEAFKKM